MHLIMQGDGQEKKKKTRARQESVVKSGAGEKKQHCIDKLQEKKTLYTSIDGSGRGGSLTERTRSALAALHDAARGIRPARSLVMFLVVGWGLLVTTVLHPEHRE